MAQGVTWLDVCGCLYLAAGMAVALWAIYGGRRDR